MCGGTTADSPRLSPVTGLSPRVRGNPGAHAFRHLHLGSIPACAGEPCGAAAPTCRGKVYPRVCGGTVGGLDELAVPPGLSPRVRGNPTTARPSARPAGSIPACAGEPGRRPRPVRRRTVYPRVCGGTNQGDVTATETGGLSPRVRGNPAAGRHGGAGIGSIPACAGEPASWTTSMRNPKVYPRVCGGTSDA